MSEFVKRTPPILPTDIWSEIVPYFTTPKDHAAVRTCCKMLNRMLYNSAATCATINCTNCMYRKIMMPYYIYKRYKKLTHVDLMWRGNDIMELSKLTGGVITIPNTIDLASSEVIAFFRNRIIEDVIHKRSICIRAVVDTNRYDSYKVIDGYVEYLPPQLVRALHDVITKIYTSIMYRDDAEISNMLKPTDVIASVYTSYFNLVNSRTVYLPIYREFENVNVNVVNVYYYNMHNEVTVSGMNRMFKKMAEIYTPNIKNIYLLYNLPISGLCIGDDKLKAPEGVNLCVMGNSGNKSSRLARMMDHHGLKRVDIPDVVKRLMNSNCNHK